MRRETDDDRLLLARFICLENPERAETQALLERMRYLFGDAANLESEENLRALLVAAVRKAPNNPDAMKQYPILAARHLLNLEEYPRGDDENAIIDGTNWTVKSFLVWAKDARVRRGRFDPHSIFTQRRAIAANAGKYGNDRLALIPSTERSGAGISFATTIFAALDQLHQDEQAFEPFRAKPIEPKAVLSAEETSPVETDSSGQRSEAPSAADDPEPQVDLEVEAVKVAGTEPPSSAVDDEPEQAQATEPAPELPPDLPTPPSHPKRTRRRIAVASIGALLAPALFAAGDTAPEPYWDAGWGPDRPTYTMQHPAPEPVFNSIIDNPVYGDERNFVNVKPAEDTRDGGWRDHLWARPGDTVLVRIYVENSAADNLGVVHLGWIKGAGLTLSMSHGDGQHSIQAMLQGVNVKAVWDGVTIHADEDVIAEWVPDSLTLFSNFYPGPEGLKLDQNMALAGGVLLGGEEIDGDIKPGYEYALYIYAELEIKKKA